MVTVLNNARDRWDYRADLAEQAVTERHAKRLWAFPRTNLAVIAWPPTTRDKFFVRWHYWWQAHYLDNQVDAAQRRPTKTRIVRIRQTARTIRMRNLQKLSKNNYYDDKAWLALSMKRASQLSKIHHLRGLRGLIHNIYDGVDGLTGVLPWRTGENFYNVPTNGPAAILAARTGELKLAENLIDWTFEHLINEKGLVMDGLHMRMHGPEAARQTYSYCQGVMLGACTELAVAQRKAAGVAPDEVSEVGIAQITRVQKLVSAIEEHMTDENHVLSNKGGGGDGGLFNGVLMRYLALVALELPGVSDATKRARQTAHDIVMATAESAWKTRLEVDGLPVFSVNWRKDATLPQTGGLVGATIAGAVSSSDIAERDLSVQLSGWMLMEAAAKLAAADAAAAAGEKTSA